MSSISKTPSNNNMISFESSEESSWTKYFEDFFNNDHNNNDDYNDQKISINSFSAFDDGSSSLVSDAANSLVGEKKLVDQSAQGGMEYIKRLSFKKRKKIKTSLVDHDLEDTASSPINSPKALYMNQIFKAKEKEEINHFYQEKGNTPEQKDERKEVGFNESSDHTELNKKGLCLVPMSMVLSYIG